MDTINKSIQSLKCYKMKQKLHPKCKNWLVQYQCPLIIEEHDDGVTNTPFFYQFYGLQCGLHKDRCKHLKRVHLIIQGTVGVYLEKNLHINTHYQITIGYLSDFLTTLKQRKYEIKLTPKVEIQKKRYSFIYPLNHNYCQNQQ